MAFYTNTQEGASEIAFFDSVVLGGTNFPLEPDRAYIRVGLYPSEPLFGILRYQKGVKTFFTLISKLQDKKTEFFYVSNTIPDLFFPQPFNE